MMMLPRSSSPSKSQTPGRFVVNQSLETLEARKLFCALHGSALEEALAQASARTAGAAATDHSPAWYSPVGSRSIGGDTASGDDNPSVYQSFTVNAAGLPLLTSRADGQGLKVFLDFDGYGTDAPFSTDADTATFNASEQVNIYETWRDIVSYLSPLNVNVTTIQPPVGGSNPAFIWHRISNSISGGAAYVGWFTNERSNSWTGQDGGTSRHSGVAHEIGHQLGLSHQAEYDSAGNKSDEYSDGFSNRDRTIIGVDFSENVRTWFYGRNSDGASNLQSDLDVMSSTVVGQVGGNGYRPDDYAGTTASAAVVPASGMISGIIEQSADTDVFRFTSTGGTYQIAATPTFESAVSPKIELLDASGTLIAARDDADQRNYNNNNQEVSLNLAAGTYYVRVSSSGDYGEQGEYLLTAAPLPTGWTSTDIGANTIYRGGTGAFDPTNNTYTSLGGGADIWNTSDQFRFTYATLNGDGSITARIDALDNVDQHAKAGVMIRASTAATSASVFVGIKPSGQLDPIARTVNNGGSSAIGNTSGAVGPWVRLTRTGNLFTVEKSVDGVTWQLQGTTSVSMSSAVLIGFATCARNARRQAYATLSNIAVSGNLGTPAPTYNALPAPTGLTATASAGASTAIDLAWDAVSGAVGYLLERSNDGVNFANLATLTTTSFTAPLTFGSMRYFFRVRASDGTSTYSAPSAVASAMNKPNAPINPVSTYAQPVIRPDATHILLNWSDVQGDNGYRVERSTSGGGFVTIATTPKNFNAYNDTVMSGTAYSYRITPLTSVGDGVAPSFLLSTTSLISAPANFVITSRTTSSMSFSWSDLTNETGYRLERSTDGSTFSTVLSVAANTTTATISGLSALTRYYFRLRALDSNSTAGQQSSAFAATPAADALPAGWTGADIGTVPGIGASAGTVGGTWSVIGSGNDIWNTADQFHYASRTIAGDGSITAQLTALDDTDFYVKGGVMFRASSAAGSAYFFMHYSTGPGLQVEYRDSTGAGSGNLFQLASTARWLRITRTANTFVGQYSADGSTWTTAATRTIAMPANALVGLAATSHNVNRMTLATFSNVTTVGGSVNSAPTIVTPASASPSIVHGTTSTLSVVAADDGGAANLSYSWSIVSKPGGVADPTFTPNNTNGASTTQATFTSAGIYTLRVTVSDAQRLSVSSNVTVQVALDASNGVYDYDAAQPRFTVQFNGNVDTSLTASDLQLVNMTTGATIPTSQITRSYDTASNTATFAFLTAPNGTLPDGNYRATFAAGSLIGPSLVTLSADASFDFFVLAGDMNRNRTVDFSDLLVLAQNYGSTGKRFSEGNLTYDANGVVSFDDLLLLSQNYGLTIAPLSALYSPATPASAKPKRSAGSALIELA